ncbi:MAG: DUF262 domain-containing protein [Dehalococcoidia bacterium]
MSEITPSSLKIDRIINRIEEGDIKIPAFQRGFVWNQDQVIQLIDSIYNDYPIGSILLWNSRDTLKSHRNVGGFLIPDRDPQYPVNYVLDGQQRLTAIYAVFCKDRREVTEAEQRDTDPETFDIYFDLDDKKFLAKEDLVEEHANLAMSALFDVERFLKELEKLGGEYRKIASETQSKFQNYEVSVVTTSKRSKEEVGTIFERINNTGTKLTTLDLMIAWTWSEDFHLREEIEEILGILERKGFGDTPEKIVLQCLSGIVDKSTRTKDIISLKPETVRTTVDTLKESLEKAVDFLATELNIKSRDFLPHSHQIVPLTFFFSQVNTPTQEQSRVVKQWFWKTSFSRRYSGSTDTKMNDDISFFEEIVNHDYSGISRYSYSVDENLLVNQPFSKSNPFTRAFLLLLAQNEPLNLVNGNKIDLGDALSQYNSKEYHHIFPRAFLKERGVENNRINSLCNFCFLPSDSNRIILKRPPSDYIFGELHGDAYATRLTSNLMPLRKELYSKDQYDNFLKQRAQTILQYLDNKIVS